MKKSTRSLIGALLLTAIASLPLTVLAQVEPVAPAQHLVSKVTPSRPITSTLESAPNDGRGRQFSELSPNERRTKPPVQSYCQRQPDRKCLMP